MTLIFQAVLVMLATVVSTLVESTDLPPVPEDSNHTAKLEGSEPLPLPAEHYELEPTAILPHERAYGQSRTGYNDIRYVTKTEYMFTKTVTKTVTISPTEVPAKRPNQNPDYCKSNGMFLYGPTNECFKFLNDRVRSFKDADAQCRKEGMRLAKPKNPNGIQKHLVNVIGSSGHVYIGARGDGQSFKWQRDRDAISNTDPNWWTGMPLHYITTDKCLVLVAKQHAVNKGMVYYPETCSMKLTALCQREECSPQCFIGNCEGPNTCVYDPMTACMPPYEMHRQLGCVYISNATQKVTWGEAKVKCEDMGGQLIVNPPLEELLHYTTENGMGKTYVWVGGKYTGNAWTWLDGSIIEEGWNQNEPDDFNIKACTYFNFDGEGLLNDHKCSYKKQYICEFPKNS